MKKVPLTGGKFALVDDDDFEWLSRKTWYWGQRYAYSQVYLGFADGKRKRKTTMMHRAILGAKPEEVVDHKNHDTLDNRKSNLRLCNTYQNAQNARRSNGFKGVSKHGTKWIAQIDALGKRYYLGRFVTPELAAKAYDSAAIKHHGEFAFTNFGKG